MDATSGPTYPAVLEPWIRFYAEREDVDALTRLFELARALEAL